MCVFIFELGLWTMVNNMTRYSRKAGRVEGMKENSDPMFEGVSEVREKNVFFSPIEIQFESDEALQPFSIHVTSPSTRDEFRVERGGTTMR